MRIITNISEDEMIAEFLRAEIASHRWQKKIDDALYEKGFHRSLLESPDITNDEQNQQRKEILAAVRGYGKDDYLFSRFPNNVRWVKAKLAKEVLKDVLYMNYSYWVQVTDNSRNPDVYARKIQEGTIQEDSKIQTIKQMAEKIRSGYSFSPLIFVAQNTESKLILLEGHFRLSAMLLSFEHISKEIDVIVGFSKSMNDWKYY